MSTKAEQYVAAMNLAADQAGSVDAGWNRRYVNALETLGLEIVEKSVVRGDDYPGGQAYRPPLPYIPSPSEPQTDDVVYWSKRASIVWRQTT